MQYRTKGTCSTMINLQRAEDVIPKIEGIRCGFRNTSCPDQLSKALRQAIGQ